MIRITQYPHPSVQDAFYVVAYGTVIVSLYVCVFVWDANTKQLPSVRRCAFGELHQMKMKRLVSVLSNIAAGSNVSFTIWILLRVKVKRNRIESHYICLWSFWLQLLCGLPPKELNSAWQTESWIAILHKTGEYPVRTRELIRDVSEAIII